MNTPGVLRTLLPFAALAIPHVVCHGASVQLRPDPSRHRSLLTAFLLAAVVSAGCATSANDDDLANDDDSANDDDLANDYDSADPPCAGAVLPEVDLTDLAEARDLVVFPIGLLQLGQTLADAPRLSAEPACPTLTGTPPGGGAAAGAFTLTGDGCVTSAGMRYDGVLDVTWTVDGVDRRTELLGTAFTMSWDGTEPAPSFARIGLDGTYVHELDDHPDGKVITVESTGWFQAELPPGSPSAESLPTPRLFPEGWDGTWTMERVSDDAAAEFWTVDAAVVARCRGPVAYDWEMQARGPCKGEPATGTLTTEAGGVEMVIDIDADTTCDGCLDHTLDGVPQPAPLCLAPGR